MNNNLSSFLETGYKNIVGFCPVDTIYALDYLETIDINKKHGVMEIGIHHGQFFIGLNSIIDRDALSVAIDIFDRQDLNIDNSGEGNREIFVDNLYKYDVHKGNNVIIIDGDSTDPRIFNNDIPNEFRYISIDGGHTVEHLMNDMQIASKYISNEGVVIVDDYFNHWWPSVTEGIYKYLSTSPNLVPFMSTPNKLWFSKISYKKRFYDHMNTVLNNKTCTKFYGHDIIDIYI